MKLFGLILFCLLTFDVFAQVPFSDVLNTNQETYVCIPKCENKECGPDGCGGICGNCGEGEICSDLGTCQPSECGSITFVGCCQGPTILVYCDEDGKLVEIDCSENSWPPFCGFDPDNEFYDCGLEGEGSTNPDFPYSCAEPCVKDCKDRECGPDGCGGLCGMCKEEEYCDVDGKCHKSDCNGVSYEGCCTPDQTLLYCEGNKLFMLSCDEMDAEFCGWNEEMQFYDCMTDGYEDPSGKHPYSCEKGCIPNCKDKECGPDGCGKHCGACKQGYYCDKGKCLVSECQEITEIGCCEVDGTLKYCVGGSKLVEIKCGEEADPGCGWDETNQWYDCGTDGKPEPTGTYPYSCAQSCVKKCEGKECGPDGCGGFCGDCGEGEVCSLEGKCEVTINQCGDVTEVGCCEGEVLKFCSKGKVVDLDCKKEGKEHCGWSVVTNAYMCGTDGKEDPSGIHKKNCYPSMIEEMKVEKILEQYTDISYETGNDILEKDIVKVVEKGKGGGGGCIDSNIGSLLGFIPFIFLFVLRRCTKLGR